MRHVDHAHHAEGDGKPDGGEEQHRAERNAVPGVLHRLPDGEPILDGADRGCSACRDRRGNVGRQAGQEPKGLLVTALADHVDGRELVFFAAFVAREDDSSARFDQRALHACIMLLRQRRFDGRQRIGLPRFEYGLRGLKAYARIAGKERQPAERGFDRAAQPVVDAHIVDIGGGIAADRLSARRVEKLAGTVFDVHHLGLAAVHQLAVLQGAQDRFGARTAAGSHVFDAGCRFAEVIGAEMRQRLVETCCACDRTG